MAIRKENIEDVNKLFAELTKEELDQVSLDPWKQYLFLYDPDTGEWIALNPEGNPVGVDEIQSGGKTHLLVRSLGGDVEEGLQAGQALVKAG